MMPQCPATPSTGGHHQSIPHFLTPKLSPPLTYHHVLLHLHHTSSPAFMPQSSCYTTSHRPPPHESTANKLHIYLLQHLTSPYLTSPSKVHFTSHISSLQTSHTSLTTYAHLSLLHHAPPPSCPRHLRTLHNALPHFKNNSHRGNIV